MPAVVGGVAVTARVQLSRQWVPMVGGSCDVRMGEDALHNMSKVLRDSVGRPNVCLVVVRAGEDAEVVEEVCRQAADAGFSWQTCALDAPLRTLANVSALAQALLAAGATADDLCCAVGDADLISVVSFACGTWCQGMSVVAVPLDELGLLEGALVPRALDVGDAQAMMAVRPCARHVVLDLDRSFTELEDEASRRTRVLMVGAAIATSEKEFSALWDKAPQIMADDGAQLCAQLMATAKARGKLAASTAAAVRASLRYGRTFADACHTLSPDLAYADLLGEGMRFCARLSVAMEKLSLDDMLAQDELLEDLGIGSVVCDVDPSELLASLRRERLQRSRRLMLELPLAMGRVRLTTVDEGLVAEHVSAWCASHRG